ncbi:MAG TPA: peptidylprolyl isomerase [Candidatus Nanoarchaeia archaeon]|nr:peptidylprolyl isomerase [Candidatus Nanoarchaeia archaeon]
MATNKNDFVELEFIGKIKDGEIFDTNITKEAEKIGIAIDETSFIICIGQGMVIPGLDKALENKETGKKYSVEIAPKEAFKDRNPSLVKLIPIKAFKEKNVNPYPGMTLALDNMLVKIISVSGGRVLADFNNPLSGKIVTYEFTVKRKIENINEKVQAITDYFIKKETKFEIKDEKIILDIENNFVPITKILNSKFKQIINLEFEVKNN